MSLPGPLIAVLVVAASAQSAAGQISSLDRYVQMGLESNRELARERTEVRKAEARWSESRAARLPTVQLEARFSAAEGGRTFDVPMGDLLNPVYATLNDLTGTRQFPTLGNRTFPLLREREQDTRMRVTQVVWNPAVGADARSKRFELQAARAGTEAAGRALVRDIRTAYYDYANATRAEEIFDAALDLVTENERSSSAMWRTSLVTRDVVHRARVERLEVEGRLARAATDRQLAASYFNYLLGRELDASIDLDEADLELPGTGTLARAGAVPPGDDPAGAILRRPYAGVAGAGLTTGYRGHSGSAGEASDSHSFRQGVPAGGVSSHRGGRNGRSGAPELEARDHVPAPHRGGSP
jgi:outer membrane protein TolC